MFKRISILVGALALAALAPMALAVKPVTIKFSFVTTLNTPKGKAAQAFKEYVEKASGGAMKVELYPSSQLYKDNAEGLNALIFNNIQLLVPSATKLKGYNPAFQFVDMPYLFRDNDHFKKFTQSDAAQKLLTSLEKAGLVGLGFWPNGFKHFTANKPLRRPADFKGLKFRTQTSGVLEAQMKALGATAVPLAFSEVYQALQQGVVDGQENTLSNIYTQRYYEVQKYLSLTGHGRLDYVVITNKIFLNSLDPEQKKIFMDGIAHANDVAFEEAVKLNADALAKLSELMEVVKLTDEDRAAMEAAMKPVYDEYGPKVGWDLINAIKALK
ncbi:TRAP dicarboxylate transporter, DctP subunit [Oceanithermus profundus DSM 14977]|uniref:TRAP dicarboxylate transporter, DctP subunit n=1 Tax=Oceanithermus profundus (strain DSM 14977 / NBRC 100410 / VKM B-2274 / 506) TaxID=670487 RepID=E4U6K1_OCEP5|nr:TRAP transporter substrate-binding protein [Oceanithermus profundus]ADR35687.1 TRAP dicarboxylate transporter, DctP subunit [Oceanithermus profundus DSM 14977]